MNKFKRVNKDHNVKSTEMGIEAAKEDKHPSFEMSFSSKQVRHPIRRMLQKKTMTLSVRMKRIFVYVDGLKDVAQRKDNERKVEDRKKHLDSIG